MWTNSNAPRGACLWVPKPTAQTQDVSIMTRLVADLVDVAEGQGRAERLSLNVSPKWVKQVWFLWHVNSLLYSFQSVQFFYLCGQSGDSQVPHMWNRKFRTPSLGVCKKFSKIIGSWASPQNHYGSSGWSLGICISSKVAKMVLMLIRIDPYCSQIWSRLWGLYNQDKQLEYRKHHGSRQGQRGGNGP